MTIIIEVDESLVETIDMRSKLSGLSRERLTALDVKFANLSWLHNALEVIDETK